MPFSFTQSLITLTPFFPLDLKPDILFDLCPFIALTIAFLLTPIYKPTFKSTDFFEGLCEFQRIFLSLFEGGGQYLLAGWDGLKSSKTFFYILDCRLYNRAR